MITGYALIAIPMPFLLVAAGRGDASTRLHQLLALGAARRRATSWGAATSRPSCPTRSSGRRIEHALLHGRVGPADDGPRSLPRGDREPEAPRPDVLPRGLLLPDARELRRDHGPVAVPPRAGRPVQRHSRGARPQSAFEALGFGPNQNWLGTQRHRAELGHHPQRLDYVGDGHALLPDVPPDDRRSSTRPPRSTAPAPGRPSGRSRSRCCAPPTSSSATCR